MALLDQYVCDWCGELLHGTQGTAIIHKDYLNIKGTITFQTFNPTTRKKEFVYITDRPNQLMTFCNTTCLKALGEDTVKRQWAKQEYKEQYKPYIPKYDRIINPNKEQ